MTGDVKREWFENDYYAALGVSGSATDEEISKAYRNLARKHHPDRNGGDPKAEGRFKEVSAAYDVIGDQKRRAEYDQVRKLGPLGGAFGGTRGAGPGVGGFEFDPEGFGDLSDVLGSMFGGSVFGQRGERGTRGSAGFGTRPGNDIEAELAIDFEEAVAGTTTSLLLRDGADQRSMKVRIPAGVESGQRIRLRGKGGPGSPPGDLYVQVSVAEHKVYGRKGTNLTLDVPVTIAEAALGADIEVPTYQGSMVTVRIPAGTQTGRVLRVRGVGVLSKQGNSERAGDLLVTVRVVVPTELNAIQKRALEAFAEADEQAPRRDFERSSK